MEFGSLVNAGLDLVWFSFGGEVGVVFSEVLLVLVLPWAGFPGEIAH